MFKTILLMAIVSLAVSQLYASPLHLGEEHGPRPGPGEGGGSGGGRTPQIDINFVNTKISSVLEATKPSVPHFEAPSFESITEKLKKKIQFAPYLEVAPNRGSFKTSFSIPLPANFSPISSLTFSYDSQHDRDGHFGVGISIALPMIETSVRGKEYAPFIVSGLGSGELVAVPEEQGVVESRRPLLEKLLKKVQLPCEQLTPYRAFIDETGNSYVAVSNNAGKTYAFVVSTFSGEQYIFNSDGYPIYASDVIGNGISLNWTGDGRLIGIQDDLWSAQLTYEKLGQSESDFPVFYQGTFTDFAYKLTNVIISHKNPTLTVKKINFQYDMNLYLTKVAYEGAKFPFFEGNYQSLENQNQSIPNEYTANDNKRPVLTYRNQMLTFVDDPKSEVKEIYIDIDNDLVVDKIVFDPSKKNAYIRNKFAPQNLYGDFKNLIHYPSGDTVIYPRSLNVEELAVIYPGIERGMNETPTEISFYKGVLNADGQTVTFNRYDRFYNIESWNYEPNTFIVRHRDEKVYGPVFIQVPFLESYHHALHFIDLNGDSLKDFVYCQGDPRYAYENKDSDKRPSLLVEDIIQLKGESGLTSKLKPWPKNHKQQEIPRPLYDNDGSYPIVAYQKTTPKVEDAIAISPKSFSEQGQLGFGNDFKCTPYSIFHDFNQDGIVDVLTGHTLSLRGKGSVRTLSLGDGELASLFDIQADSLDDLTIGDLTHDGRLTIFNGKGIEYNPLDGNKYIIRNGITQIEYALAQYKVLNELVSPFGGKIKISYTNTEGITTVSSIIKDPNAAYYNTRHDDIIDDYYISSDLSFSFSPQTTGIDLGGGRTPGIPLLPDPRSSRLADFEGSIDSIFDDIFREEIPLRAPISLRPMIDEDILRGTILEELRDRNIAYGAYNFEEKQDEPVAFKSSYDTPLYYSQSIVEEKFTFTQKLIDPLTKQFIGFQSSQVEKDFRDYYTNKFYDKKITQHEFNNGISNLLNTRYLSRGILHGKPSANRIKGSSSTVKESLYHWDMRQIYDSKIMIPELRQTTSNDYDKERLVSSTYVKTVKDNWSYRFLPLQEQREKSNKIVSNVLYHFDEQHYLRYPTRESVFANGALARNEVFIKVDPLIAPGKILSYRVGDISKHFNYDNYGRVTSIKEQNGYIQALSYHNKSPLVKSVTDAKGTSTAIYNEISKEIVSLTNSLGMTYNYFYSPEGILEQLKQGDLLLYDLKLPDYSPDYRNRYLEHTLTFKAWGQEHTWYLDGFGRVENSAVLQGKTSYFSGLLRFGDGYDVWSKDGPYKFNRHIHNENSDAYYRLGRIFRGSAPSRRSVDYEKYSNAFGEVTKEIYANANPDLVYEYSKNYKDKRNCKTISINDWKKDSSICFDDFGNPILAYQQGEEFTYEIDPLGELLSLPELGLRWNYDIYGRLSNAEGTKDTLLSPSWNNVSYSYDLVNGHYINNSTKLQASNDTLGRPIHIAKVGEQDSTDLTEHYEYKGMLLAKITYTDSNGQIIFTKEFSYDKEGKIISEKFNNIEEQYTYAPYGKLLAYKLLQNNNQIISESFQYEGDLLVAISPLVTSASYNQYGNLTKVVYPDDVNVLRSFEDGGTKLTQLLVTRPKDETHIVPYLFSFVEKYSYNNYHQITKREYASPEIQFLAKEYSSQDTFSYDNKTHKIENEELAEEKHITRLFSSSTILPNRIQKDVATHSRDVHGRVIKIDENTIEWNNDNLKSLVAAGSEKKYQFYYTSAGELLAACSHDTNLAEAMNKCTIKIRDDLFLHQGQVLKLKSIGGYPVAVYINKKSYPVVSDHLGSIRLMLNGDPNATDKLLWRRDYSAWGVKSVLYSERFKDVAMALESILPWSYAGLIEIPSVNKVNSNKENTPTYYFSKSRVYSPNIKAWLSIDPLIKRNPSKLLNSPHNWKSVEYASSDPVNLVDLYGTDSYQANRTIGGDEATEWSSSKTEYSHTFSFSTDIDKKGNEYVSDTYSWGNKDNPEGWNKNKPEDFKAATQALAKGWAHKIGDESYDHMLKQSFDSRSEKEVHSWVPWNNCKHATDRLQRGAEINKILIDTYELSLKNKFF
ncbi:MAG: hypothetical protein HQK50_15815 [Oligoflexia bacterium]|nr:hypothetical protein [Oligoflexia bacterium]